MKNLLIITLSALSLTAFAQQTIALLEPRLGEGSTAVTGIEKRMVQGELRKALVKFPDYEAITRTDIDQMMQEQDFQRTGMVSESQKKKLGEMSGADYICVSTITKSKEEFYLEAYLIHLESGKISNPATQYGELSEGKLSNLFFACQSMANELLGKPTTASTTHKHTSQEPSPFERDLMDKLQHPEKANLYTFDPSWSRSISFSDDCLATISLAHENVKSKQYADAMAFWEETYNNCPNGNKAIYTDGEKILQWYIEQATTERECRNYLRKLLEVYDKRIFYFGNDAKYPKAYILGKKGVSLYMYSKEPEDIALSYFLLKASIDGMRGASTVLVLSSFYEVSAWMWKNCRQHKNGFDTDFQTVRTYLKQKNSNIGNSALQKIENDYVLLIKNVQVVYNNTDNQNLDVRDAESYENNKEEEEVVFYIVEKMPEFPGGMDSLVSYLSANVKYPVIAQENGIQGRVVCQFIVNQDGSIVDVVIVKSGGDPSLDKEAVRVCYSMPKWIPGKQRGKPVRVKYTIPVNFRLK